jgi:hypothetical protein
VRPAFRPSLCTWTDEGALASAAGISFRLVFRSTAAAPFATFCDFACLSLPRAAPTRAPSFASAATRGEDCTAGNVVADDASVFGGDKAPVDVGGKAFAGAGCEARAAAGEGMSRTASSAGGVSFDTAVMACVLASRSTFGSVFSTADELADARCVSLDALSPPPGSVCVAGPRPANTPRNAFFRESADAIVCGNA